MKRLFILIVILLSSFTVPVFGLEKIITLPGVGSDALLEEEGYILHQPQVDWEEAGSYQVEYYAPSLHSTITRDIEVLSKNDLLAGVEFLSEVGQADISGLYVKNCIYISEDEYFLYGGKDTGYHPYQTQDWTCFPYLAFYRDGFLVWEKYFSAQRYGYIKDACLTEAGIAIIGDYDTPSQKRNIFVCEIDSNQSIHYTREISGSNDDYASRIFHEDGYLYLYGKTRSTDLDYYCFTYTTNDIYIGILSLTDHSYYDFRLFGNEGDDLIYDALRLNGRSYFFCRFRGEGYYYNKASYMRDYDAILYLKEDLYLGDWISLSENEPRIDPHFFTLGDKICLVSYLNDKITIQIIDAELENISEKTIILPNQNISDCHILVNESLILATISTDDRKQKSLTIFRFDDDFNQISKTTSKIAAANNLLNFYQDHQGHLIIPVVSLVQNQLYFLSYENYRLEEEEVTNADYTKYSTNLYFNNKNVEKVLVKNDIPENPFGEYRKLYLYRLNNREFYLEDVYNFHLKTNIRSHEVYDIGVAPTFNGEDYLNGKRIFSGTKIEEPGHYVLEILSAEAVETLVFSVQNLSEDPVCPETTPSLNIVSVFPNEDEGETTPSINLSKIQTMQKMTSGLYIIFSGIALGILGGILLTKIRFKGRKHA
ncbi:MAG: hypothetical protein GX661_05725 [Acholeplasmataceae bacterium]|nr:hypothetical protein [Acholeplasmataceae bacterium]